MTDSKKQRNKKPRELLDLDIREVSLVDRPAIRRKFLVIKRDEDGENMSDEQALSSEPQEAFIFDEVVCKDEEVEKSKNKADEDESDEETEDESEEEKTKAKGKTKAKADKDELEAESEDEEASEKK